jgi:hypothetical protein
MWFTKKLSRHSCLASCHVDLPITLYIDPSHQALGDGHWEQPWPQVGSDLWPLSGMISTTHEGEIPRHKLEFCRPFFANPHDDDDDDL